MLRKCVCVCVCGGSGGSGGSVRSNELKKKKLTAYILIFSKFSSLTLYIEKSSSSIIIHTHHISFSPRFAVSSCCNKNYKNE